MPSRAQLARRLTRLEQRLAERERAAQYAQPVRFDHTQYTPDEKRQILKTLLQAGAMYGAPTGKGVMLLTILGLNCTEIEAFYALYTGESCAAQVEWLAAWHERHHPSEATDEPTAESAVAS